MAEPTRRQMLSPRLRLIAVTAIFIGLLIRVLPIILHPDEPLLTCDGHAYYELAVSLAQGRGLSVDDPQVVAACLGQVKFGPSHHFAPALAVIEAGFVAVFGDSQIALALPLALISVAAVAMAWWTTRNLFGDDAALLVGAAVSLEWTGVFFGTWRGYSENLVVLAFTLTLWAILRALRDDRFLVLAGLFAGLGYLSKASIGWFFLLAGIGGFAWRLWYRGLGVLRNKWYWTAIAVFAIPVTYWALRNVQLFWDGTALGLIDAWQTSEAQARFVGAAFQQPGQLLVGLVGKLPVLIVVPLLPLLPLLPGLREAARRWKEEEVSGMWLAVALCFGLGLFFAAAFWVTEQTSLLWGDPVRYVTPAQVPLLWLMVMFGRPQATWRWTVAFVVMAVMSIYMHLWLVPGTLLGP